MGITDTAKWRAVYKDGTMLNEVDKSDGRTREHAFKEIKFSELEYFQLINDQNIAICQVHLGGEKRLIFTRRNIKTTGRRMIMQGNVKVPVPVNSHKIVIILGWQKTIKGVNSKSIFYLLPDGRLEMDDEWKEDSLHSKVNTPGLIQEEEPKSKQTFNSLGGKPVSENETKEKSYSTSNDSAFKNKS